jgi:hypothetical protein
MVNNNTKNDLTRQNTKPIFLDQQKIERPASPYPSPSKQ